MQQQYFIAVTIVVLLGTAVAIDGDDKSPVVVQHVQKDQPIVVQTQLQNYEQPTLKEYEECQDHRKQCVENCDYDEKCLSECPLCPELYDHPVVIQGVNDTDIKVQTVPVNTTNIIRLTNEINNIIHTDIQAHNENNIQIKQNISSIGGRFGLGYNEHGSCCLVVRRSRECENKDHCEEKKRIRVCGSRCQARVMHARRVVQCDSQEPPNCHETVEYVPARRHHSKHREQNSCRYLNTWPFVSCDSSMQQQQQNDRVRRSVCQRCLELPYGQVLQHGLPVQCGGCFPSYAIPMTPMWSVPFGYNYNSNNNNNNNGFWNENETATSNVPKSKPDDGWVMESHQCLGDDGTLQDCLNDNKSKSTTERPNDHENIELGSGGNSNIEIEDPTDYEDVSYHVPAQRRRRRRHNRRRSSRINF